MLKRTLFFLLPISLMSVSLVFPAKTENKQKTITHVETSEDPSSQQNKSKVSFNPFTGRVSRNKVRLRLDSNIDSHIIKELDRNEMLLVVGETDDFFAVKPPSETQAYIFRTYVLEGFVEGSHVNVRLEPDLDAPVITQLNSGDEIHGKISPLNSKWYEITLPESTFFYVAKEFINKAGDQHLLDHLTKQKEQVNHRLTKAYTLSQSELKNEFEEIDFENVRDRFQDIIDNYVDFPEQTDRAKELLNLFQDAYIQKKIAYLELKSHDSNTDLESKNKEFAHNIETYKKRLSEIESKLEKHGINPSTKLAEKQENVTSHQFSMEVDDLDVIEEITLPHSWEPLEQLVFENWQQEDNFNREITEFYEEESLDAITLKGVIQPYERPIKNKPGDYVLVDRKTRLPVGYIYSIKIDLQDKIGQEVTMLGSPRPNNNFAFPAYHIIAVE